MRPYQNLLRRLAPLALLSSLLVAVAPAQKPFAWGDNGVGQLNIPGAAQTGVSKVQAGYYFSLFLKDGGLYACGDNSYGELNIPVAAQSGVTKFTAGVLHSLAIKDGGVIAWGSNERGETTVPAAALSGVTAVSAGEYYSIALKDGGVIGWGSNDYGVLTVPVAAQSGVSTIASGSYHSLALKNGGVIAWGMNVANSTDVPVAAQSNVVAIACGYLHSLALKSDGSVVAWGWNNMGQCNVPVAAQSGVVAISAGYDFSWALKDDGSLIGWGDNDYGWLNIPADTAPLVAISSTAYHTLALKAAAWATLDQTQVFSGDAATGTVHLSTPAGPGGVQVNLTSDNANVHVPAYAVVPEGATEMTFPVTTDGMFGPDVPVKIQTSYNDTATVPAKMTLKAAPVTISFSAPSVIGGSTTNATVTLSLQSTFATPKTFTLTSTSPTLLTVPTTITVPANQLSATVPLTHYPVTSRLQASVAIRASFSGTQVGTASLLINAFRATLQLDSPSVTAGQSTNVLVTLSATTRDAITVYTWGSDSGVTLPASVTIGAGTRTATIPIVTNPSPIVYTFPFGVTIRGNTFSTTLGIHSTQSVVSVSLVSSMYGNSKILGTIRLSRAADPGGAVINIASTGGLIVPAQVTVPGGLTTATFDVTAPDVTAPVTGQVTVTSSVNQMVKSVLVNPLAPISFNMSAAEVGSGSSFTGTVVLQAAPVVDTQVQIQSADPLVTVPASVTVLAGTTTATFTGTAGTTTKAKYVKVTASKNGKAIAKSIKVVPVP